jgi:hypothetical protein
MSTWAAEAGNGPHRQAEYGRNGADGATAASRGGDRQWSLDGAARVRRRSGDGGRTPEKGRYRALGERYLVAANVGRAPSAR